VRNCIACYPLVLSMNIFNFLNQFHYNSMSASQVSRYTLMSYMYPTVTKLVNFYTKPLIFSGNVLLKDDIVWILWFFLFLVGWDWVHLVLRPLLAYCTSPRW
jgi:hypothetical protein